MTVRSYSEFFERLDRENEMPLDTAEVAKQVETNGGTIGTITAGILTFLAALMTWLKRRGDTAKIALVAAHKAAAKADEIKDSVQEDIRRLDIRTRRTNRSVKELNQQWKWFVEQNTADRENTNARLATLHDAQMATHAAIVDVAARFDERAKMRAERMVRTRASDPLTPVPYRIGEE